MRAANLAFSIATLPLMLMAQCWPAPGAEIRSGDEVVIKADETIKDDLYVLGRQVTIDGTVEGDVVAFAQRVTVNGAVKGHIMAAGQTVILGGSSDGARVAGQAIKLDSKANLDGDLLAAGMSLECSKESSIVGDALFAGYQGLFAGQIGADLRGAMSNCRLAGTVGGDVDLKVGEKNSPPATTFGQQPPGVSLPSVTGGLAIADSAELEGDLTYRAPDEASIDSQAKVSGEVKHVLPEPTHKGAAAAAKPTIDSKALGRLKHVICVGLIGFLAILVFPRWSTERSDAIRTRPAASFVSGIAGIVAFFVLLFVLLFVIAIGALLLSAIRLNELVPLMVISGMVGYAALVVGFWLVFAFLAEALTGLAIGRSAMGNESLAARAGALIVGVLLIGIVLSVPYLGALLGLIVVIFGIGSICLWLIAPGAPQSFAIQAPIKAMSVPESMRH
jgi:cytoskeletal protein CcmA (bactofilin family)